MSKKHLTAAKKVKNDEFYTRLDDVSNELKHYKHHFKDKVVYCNCDDPTWSAFWRYFHLQFKQLGLKKLISTHYDAQNVSYKMEYTGGDDNDVNVGIKTVLQGNGDFRNQECIDVLKESDVIVTNPPFSLFREYVAQLVQYDKKFLIVGNKNALTYKEIFPLIKNDKMWIGITSPSEFDTPTGATKKINGLCRWFTNLDVKKRHEKLVLWKDYKGNEDDYPKYDNYDAINVDNISDIPRDYKGVMGVPITYLDNYNPEQFEIVALGNSKHNFTPTKSYKNPKKHTKDGKIISGKAVDSVLVIERDKPLVNKVYYTSDNSKYLEAPYARVLIKKK